MGIGALPSDSKLSKANHEISERERAREWNGFFLELLFCAHVPACPHHPQEECVYLEMLQGTEKCVWLGEKELWIWGFIWVRTLNWLQPRVSWVVRTEAWRGSISALQGGEWRVCGAPEFIPVSAQVTLSPSLGTDSAEGWYFCSEVLDPKPVGVFHLLNLVGVLWEWWISQWLYLSQRKCLIFIPSDFCIECCCHITPVSLKLWPFYFPIWVL